MKKKILLLFLPVLFLTGCLNQGLSEVPLELSSDKEDVFAVADIMTGDGELTKTIKVISNRSWSAHLNDLKNPIDESDATQSVPWGSLDIEEHSNVTGVTDEVEITVNFNRNYSKEQINGVLNIYSEGMMRKSIPLTQAGAVYVVKVEPVNAEDVSDNGGTIFLNVTSNTHWKASIDPSTTADAVLLTAEGVDSGEIKVRVRSNDDESEKILKLVVTAEDCENQVVELKQKPIDPSVKLIDFNVVPVQIGTKKTKFPGVGIDMAGLDPALVAAGVKFYYKASTEGFSDNLIPDTSCPEVPETGIDFAREMVKMNQIYVQILGTCPGYRDVNMKVHCRYWRLGLSYITTSELGLYISNAFSAMKDDYVTYDSKRTEIGTNSVLGGKASAFRIFYNNTSTTQMTFWVGGKNAGSYTYANKETTSSNPEFKVSTTESVNVGDKIYVENTNKKKGQIFSFGCLEQITYKP